MPAVLVCVGHCVCDVCRLRAERVRSSAPQTKALLKALRECLLYVLTGADEEEPGLATDLLQQVSQCAISDGG